MGVCIYHCVYLCVYKSLHLCVCTCFSLRRHTRIDVWGRAAYAQIKGIINYYFSGTPVSLFFETRSNTCLVLK